MAELAITVTSSTPSFGSCEPGLLDEIYPRIMEVGAIPTAGSFVGGIREFGRSCLRKLSIRPITSG